MWNRPEVAVSESPSAKSDDQSAAEGQEGQPAGSLTIIIPSLNAVGGLPRTLKSIERARKQPNVIVVDGGSTDGTQRLATAHGCQVVDSPKGRGMQLRRGAELAKTDWLLFLHADTQLQLGWDVVVQDFMSRDENKYRAGYFALILDDPARAARRVETLANVRSKWLGLPYGDQALLIRKDFYDYLGGYPDQPLMEDVALARRIGGSRLSALPSAAITSAVRFQREGYWRRPLKNLALLALYLCGASPRWLAKLYG